MFSKILIANRGEIACRIIKTAQKIVLNAKLRNTAICGATETILIHQKILKQSCKHI